MATEIASQKPQRLIVHDESPLAYMLDTQRFEHSYRIATAISQQSLLPDHLRLDRNKQPLPREAVAANCLRIVNQAIRWNVDPFALVDETYVVAGRLGYQGKLIIAIVNARAGLVGRLSYEFTGRGTANLAVTVSGTFRGSRSPQSATLTLKQAKTPNKMWITDPEQKLIYSAVTRWARRFCPEVLLGILTEDDIDRIESRAEAIDVEPVTSLDDLAERMASPAPAPAPEPEPEPEPQPQAEEPPKPEPTPEAEPEPDPQAEHDALLARIKAASGIIDTKKVASEIDAHPYLTDEMRSGLYHVVNTKIQAIRDSRGNRSN